MKLNQLSGRNNVGANSRRLRTLLAGTALSCTVFAAPAAAQDYGILVSTPGTQVITNQQGDEIIGSRVGIFAYEGAIDLTNHGTIRGNGSADGPEILPEGGITIEQPNSRVVNTGMIYGEGFGISTAHYWDGTGFQPRATGTRIENSGTIRGNTRSGVRLIGGGTVTNSGTIEGGGGDGIAMWLLTGQDGSDLSKLGTVTNNAGGTITGSRLGVFFYQSGGEVQNAGTITGSEAAVVVQAISGETGKIGTIGNSGTMTGGDGVRIWGDLASASLTNSGDIQGTTAYGVYVGTGDDGEIVITNEADGEITGAASGIFAETGTLSLTNSGTIRGNGTSDDRSTPPGAGITIASPDAEIVNNAGGIISGAGFGITTAYYWNPEASQLEPRAIGTNITNHGTIRGDANDGIRLIGGGTVTNSGTIVGTSTTPNASHGVDGISMFGFDGRDRSGQDRIGTVTNNAGGTISGQRYGIILSGGGEVINAGTISGGTGAIRIQGDTTSAKTAIVDNSGTLTGGVSIGFNVDSVDVSNTGTITGEALGYGIVASARTVAIDNAGTITATGDESWAVHVAAAETLEFENSDTIEGVNGVHASAGGSSLTFLNSGTIRGLGTEEESGEAVFLATGYNELTEAYTVNAETASFENTASGVIEGEVTMEFYADAVNFLNSGIIRATEPGDSVIDLSVGTLDAARPGSVTFINEGQITGAIESELSAATITFINRGSILSENSPEYGGQPALDIETMTAGSQSVSFTNATGGSIVSKGVGGIGVIVDAAAGFNAPEEEEGEPTMGDDPNVRVEINAVNNGNIIANDGGDVEDVSDWGIPGVDTMITLGGGIGLVGLAPQSAVTLTNGATGVIEAKGDYSIAVYAEAGSFTLNNAGTITGGIGSLIDASMEDGGDLTVIHDLLEVGSTYIAGAIQTLDSVDTITNSGTITGSVDLNNRDDLFINSGIVNGTVDMGDGNDVVRLMTGSSVTGTFYGAEGTDRFELAGTNTALSDKQVMAVADGFEQLLVSSGYWLANTAGAANLFDTVTIAQGATLDVREVSVGGGAASAIVTENVVNNGLLILNFNSDDLADIDYLAISGTGGVTLAGEANFVADQNSLTFTGLTTIANGSLTLMGDARLTGDLTTTGDGLFVLGEGGSFEGDLVNNGRFIFAQAGDYDFLGDFSGTGSFVKQGDGTLTFMGDYSYTGTTLIEGGTVKFTGAIDPETEVVLEDGGTFDISGTPQTIAELSGTGGSIILDDSELTVNQSTNTAFGGDITGDGALIKSGSGRLNLTGNSTYTGPTVVNEGAIAVNGSIVSTVRVNDGGTLMGSGTIGGAVITGNGTVAPGNSIGTLNVAGDISFAVGSIFEVEVNADGRSDQILATGQALIDGGIVSVIAEAGTFRPFTEYLIIRADGGVNGEFDEVRSDSAFLSPTLTYSANEVRLELRRNNVNFEDVAQTANQENVAAAIEGLGITNDLYADISLLTEASARQAFDALSGEAYASLGSNLIVDGHQVVDAVLDAGREMGGTGVWARALGDWGSFDSTNGIAGVDGDQQGVIGGVNFGAGGFTVGAAIGATRSDYRYGSRSSNAEVDTKMAALHAGYGAGPVTARIGGSYSWHDIEASRTIAFPGFSETASSAYDARTTQIFGEVGYAMPMGAMAFEPFARIEHVRVKTDGFTETGDSAALLVEEDVRKVNFASLGLRATGSIPASASMIVEPSMSAAWRHGWGDLAGRSTAAFEDSDSFGITGARLPKNALDLDVGVALRTGNVRVGVSYRGMLSNQWNSDGGQVSLSFAF